MSVGTSARVAAPRSARIAALKRWPSWLALGVIVVGLVALAASRGTGPRNNLERRDAIARTLKCPVCAGESVYESRVPIALAIKEAISRDLVAGQTDDQIRTDVSATFPGTQLTPPSSGIASLVWVLPVVAFGLAVGGLAAAFRRWHVAAAGEISDDDRRLVAAARERERKADGGP